MQRIVRNVFGLLGLSVVSASIGLAQSASSSDIFVAATNNSMASAWQSARQAGVKGKLTLVAIDHPQRRQTCRIRSFTPDKIVCSRGIGSPRTYLTQQVLALIIPGDAALTRLVVFGLNVGLGTAIWGTVVLAATCPACAVGTGIAALICFLFAGAVLFTGDQPDRLLYLAPGGGLSPKLGYIQR